ncbi:MAG: magnesium and cobalt transport protein CorA, partial [Chitinophagaceae bacterium]|nr:magnesium and cobalt transport protein CorA [Chitinophagaceae bacterium]
MEIRPDKYLRFLGVPQLFSTERTKKILSVNPTIAPHREEAGEVKICVYDYSVDEFEEYQVQRIADCFHLKNNNRISWINIDGLRKADVEIISQRFDIHYLIAEDILSINQRPKMDEIPPILYCLLNMLYFNNETSTVEQ